MQARRYRVASGEQEYSLELRSERDGYLVRVGERELRVRLSPPDTSGIRRLHVGNRVWEILAHADGSTVRVALAGREMRLEVEDERVARLASVGAGGRRAHAPQAVTAPMPGLVVRVNVEPGQSVQEGESLVVLQAMKMENELASPRAATVKAVQVRSGQAVEQGQVLVELAD